MSSVTDIGFLLFTRRRFIEASLEELYASGMRESKVDSLDDHDRKAKLAITTRFVAFRPAGKKKRVFLSFDYRTVEFYESTLLAANSARLYCAVNDMVSQDMSWIEKPKLLRRDRQLIEPFLLSTSPDVQAVLLRTFEEVAQNAVKFSSPKLAKAKHLRVV